MTLGTDILERSWGQKGSDPTVGEAGRDGNLFFPQKYVLHGFFSLVLPSRGRTPIVKPVLPEEAGNHEDSVCCLPSTNLAEFSPIFRIPFFGRAGGRSGRSGFSVHAAMHHRHPASNFLKMGRLRQRIEFPPLLERGGLWAGERFQFLALRNKCKFHSCSGVSLSRRLAGYRRQSPPYGRWGWRYGPAKTLYIREMDPLQFFIIFRVLPVT